MTCSLTGLAALVVLSVCIAPLIGEADPIGQGVLPLQEDRDLAEFAIRTSYPPPNSRDEVEELVALHPEIEAHYRTPGSRLPEYTSAKRPDYTIHVTPIAERRIAAYADAMGAWTRQSGREIAGLINNATGEQIGSLVQGSKYAVLGERLLLVLTPANDVTLIHTHPDPYSFSGTDLATFLTFPQIRRSVVRAAGGITYIFEHTIQEHGLPRISGHLLPAIVLAGDIWGEYLFPLADEQEHELRKVVGFAINQLYTYQAVGPLAHRVNTQIAHHFGFVYQRVPPRQR